MPLALEIKRAAHDVCRMASLCPLSLATNSKKKNSYSLNLCGLKKITGLLVKLRNLHRELAVS